MPSRDVNDTVSGDARVPTADSQVLERLRRVWQSLGRDDPLWAVLSHADKRGGRWDAAEFLATGKLEIDNQLAALAADGHPRGHDLALDFGCGAGRLTRALAAHFVHALGIDVSASMIAAASALNADIGNVEFRENASPRLQGVADASVDFVFSHIVLQHIPPALAGGYVEEFFRVLAPGGVAAFQFVDGTDDSLRGRLFGLASNRWLNPLRRLLWRRRDVFEMHALPERELRTRLARHPHLRLAHAFDDGAAGAGWRGRRWVVVNDERMPLRIDCDGYVVYVDADDRHMGATLRAGEVHDREVQRVLHERLRVGDVVLDIGANIGIHALLAASRVGAAGRVVAVEPVVGNARLLARSAQASGFAHVQVIAAAAAEQAGTIELRTHPATSNGATPMAAGELLRGEAGETIRVPCVALDDALADLERLDLVKVDIAGMEPRALRGFERTLARLRPALLTEFHPWAIERASRLAPTDYLEWLLARWPSITILHRDGRRECCGDAAAVMDAWRLANAAAAIDGRLHLDLLLEP